MYVFYGAVMARRCKEDAEQTRKDLLMAALDLFCEKGYSRTTFDEIAKKINLTKGAVYWHFRNKADLLTDLIKEMVFRMHDVTDVERREFLLEGKCVATQSLANLKEFFLEEAKLIKENDAYRKFLFFAIFQMEWSEPLFNKIQDTMSDIHDYPLAQIKQTLTFAQKSGEIAADVDIELATSTMFCMWKGIMSTYIGRVYKFDIVKVVDSSFDVLVNGLKLGKGK